MFLSSPVIQLWDPHCTEFTIRISIAGLAIALTIRSFDLIIHSLDPLAFRGWWAVPTLHMYSLFTCLIVRDFAIPRMLVN